MKKLVLIIYLFLVIFLAGCSLIISPSIIIEEEELNLYIGEMRKIIYNIEPKLYNKEKVNFSSDNNKVVIVSDDAYITGLRAGKATIDIQVLDVITKINVNVKWDTKMIPKLKVNTNNTAITSKDTYISGTVSVEGVEDVISINNVSMNIKGRGNSTWFMPKRPYRIKFNERTSLLGMKDAKDYVLLAEYSDKSLIRNFLAHEFSRSLENIGYSLETRFVELYINGYYEGLYLLTEQVEVDKNRLDIDDSYEVNGGFLIELDQRLYEIPEGVMGKNWFTVYGIPYNIKSPDTNSPLFTNDKFLYIQNTVKTVDDAIRLNTYKNHIDVDNFIDYFILNELFKNVDIGYSSVFFYKDKEGLLKMGPVWDMDLSLGNADYIDYRPEGWYAMNVDKNRWFHYLMKSTTFANKFKERYNYLYQNQIKELIFLIEQIKFDIQLAANFNFQKWDIMNYYVWPNPPAMVNAKTHSEQIDYVYNFFVKRSNWIYNELNK